VSPQAAPSFFPFHSHRTMAEVMESEQRIARQHAKARDDQRERRRRLAA
jgi:hypothetical protein